MKTCVHCIAKLASKGFVRVITYGTENDPYKAMIEDFGRSGDDLYVTRRVQLHEAAEWIKLYIEAK